MKPILGNKKNLLYIPMSPFLLHLQPIPSEPAKLRVQLPIIDLPLVDYWVLDTDYTTYTAVYVCVLNTPMAWVLTREPGQEPTNLARIKHHSFDVWGIQSGLMQKAPRTNCL